MTEAQVREFGENTNTFEAIDSEMWTT